MPLVLPVIVTADLYNSATVLTANILYMHYFVVRDMYCNSAP